MKNLYIVNDSQGRPIGVFDNLDMASLALVDHAESFLDDVVLVEATINPQHNVLQTVLYIEGLGDMCVEQVVAINEVV